jgi:hypothetical protein
MNTEQKQLKTVEMTLDLFPQQFKIVGAYRSDTDRSETRNMIINCVQCKEDIVATLIQDGEAIWSAAIQIKLKKHLVAFHKK